MGRHRCVTWVHFFCLPGVLLAVRSAALGLVRRRRARLPRGSKALGVQLEHIIIVRPATLFLTTVVVHARAGRALSWFLYLSNAGRRSRRRLQRLRLRASGFHLTGTLRTLSATPGLGRRWWALLRQRAFSVQPNHVAIVAIGHARTNGVRQWRRTRTSVVVRLMRPFGQDAPRSLFNIWNLTGF